VLTVKTASVELLVTLRNAVPSSLKLTSAPPASRLMSAAASTIKLFADMVKSVPSPSIFSPSSPKVTPIFAGTLMSPLEPTLNEISVPSDSIFSSP